MVPVVFPEVINLAFSSKSTRYCSGKTGGLWEAASVERARISRIIEYLMVLNMILPIYEQK